MITLASSSDVHDNGGGDNNDGDGEGVAARRLARGVRPAKRCAVSATPAAAAPAPCGVRRSIRIATSAGDRRLGDAMRALDKASDKEQGLMQRIASFWIETTGVRPLQTCTARGV